MRQKNRRLIKLIKDKMTNLEKWKCILRFFSNMLFYAFSLDFYLFPTHYEYDFTKLTFKIFNKLYKDFTQNDNKKVKKTKLFCLILLKFSKNVYRLNLNS